MHVTGAPVTKSTACLPRTSLNVTLWPLLVLPAYLTGLAADAVAGRATKGDETEECCVSFFMSPACVVAHAITSGVSLIRAPDLCARPLALTLTWQW